MESIKEGFQRLADLESFDPKAFEPDDTVSKDLCGFVLTLALIYDDIKNLSIFIRSVLEVKPEGDFIVRRDWGEFNALLNFLNRLNIGILHELFNLIESNKKNIEDKFFKEVLRHVRKDALKDWYALVDISLNRRTTTNELAKHLMLIRNKISFHYDQKMIRKGYKFLFQRRDDIKKAYISRGLNMDQSRFYFADGAAESYISSLVDSDENVESLFKPTRDAIQQLNVSIRYIVINFIQKRYAFKKV
jgi:hypothetical protein